MTNGTVFQRNGLNATNIFKKVSGGIGNVFKKVDNFAHRTAGKIADGADIVGGVLRQAGNELEKNKALVSGIAGSVGLSSAIPAILAGGSALKSAGGFVKRVGAGVKEHYGGLNSKQELTNGLANVAQRLKSQQG
jgi:hypothetical protein